MGRRHVLTRCQLLAINLVAKCEAMPKSYGSPSLGLFPSSSYRLLACVAV